MLSQLLSLVTDDNKKAVGVEGTKTEQIKIRNKTFVFEDDVYLLRNITSFSFLDLTQEKPIPKFYWVLALVSIVFLIGGFSGSGGSFVFGIAAAAVTGYLFFQHNQNKTKLNYGLLINTTDGRQQLFYSSDKIFIRKVIILLYRVIENDSEDSNITVNFQKMEIEDNSTNIGTNIASPIISGTVSGNVVSQI
jgi:hypothetical protein